MARITTRVSREQVAALDAAAAQLNRSRSQIVCDALERYLEDHDDLTVATARLHDASDPPLEWDEVRRELV